MLIITDNLAITHHQVEGRVAMVETLFVVGPNGESLNLKDKSKTKDGLGSFPKGTKLFMCKTNNESLKSEINGCECSNDKHVQFLITDLDQFGAAVRTVTEHAAIIEEYAKKNLETLDLIHEFTEEPKTFDPNVN